MHMGRARAEEQVMDDRKPSWFDPHLEDSADPAIREAIAWFNLLRGEHVAEQDRVRFRAWLRRDARHPEAFRQIEQFWSGLAGLPEARRRRRRITRRNLGKGALALALASGGLWGASRLHPFADYRTGTGERRIVTLADGSRAELSTSTALSVDFDVRTRGIELHYGEVFFEVAPDPRRPFVVDTARGRITALGTAFAVAEDGDRLVVTVTQHAVMIAAGTQSLRVEEGQQTVLDPHGIGAPVAVDTAEALAWREGRLIFVNAPLGRVVDVLNRWRTGRIVVMNRALAAQPVTLIVSLEDVDKALDQLQDALPLALTRITPLLTLLHAG